MKHSTRWGAAILTLAGLTLTLTAHNNLWNHLSGLQIMLMGLYLTALSFDPNPIALRQALRARLVLIAAILLWWCVTPDSLWWLLALSLEGTWVIITLRQPTSTPEPLKTKAFPSPAHNIILGSIPLGEGLGTLFLASLYGPFVLGVETPQEDVSSAAFFGLHTLYLAWFWLVIVRAQARRAMAATAWGRVGVALAFVAFSITGVVDSNTHLLYLAPLLVCSALWTCLELRFGPLSPSQLRALITR